MPVIRKNNNIISYTNWDTFFYKCLVEDASPDNILMNYDNKYQYGEGVSRMVGKNIPGPCITTYFRRPTVDAELRVVDRIFISLEKPRGVPSLATSSSHVTAELLYVGCVRVGLPNRNFGFLCNIYIHIRCEHTWVPSSQHSISRLLRRGHNPVPSPVMNRHPLL